MPKPKKRNCLECGESESVESKRLPTHIWRRCGACRVEWEIPARFLPPQKPFIGMRKNMKIKPDDWGMVAKVLDANYEKNFTRHTLNLYRTEYKKLTKE